MLKEYRDHVAKRAEQGIVPLPLDARQAAAVVELMKSPPKGEEGLLLDLLVNRVPVVFVIDTMRVGRMGFIVGMRLLDLGTGELHNRRPRGELLFRIRVGGV